MLNPAKNIPKLQSTSGGFSDTEANELQVQPVGLAVSRDGRDDSDTRGVGA